jgi:HAMP domain-containing protein
MLNNLRVRTKLAAVLAVPLVALVVMASIGVRDRWDEATSAREGRRLAELTAARIDLAHQLQGERTLVAAGFASRGPDELEALGAQRRRTDASLSAFARRAGSAGDVAKAVGEDVRRTLGELEQIATVRQSIDAAQTDGQVAAAYFGRALLGLAGLADHVAAAARGTELDGDLRSLATLAAVKEAQAGINATVAHIVVEGQVRAGQVEAVVNSIAQLDAQRRRFGEGASVEMRSDLLGRDASDEARRMQELLGRVTTVVTGQAVGITIADWTAAADARLGAIRDVELAATQAIGDVATSIEQRATSSARNFALGATIAVLLSLVLVSVVARSITRPLRRLTESARRLSAEQLPALVEQLKAPSDAAGDVGFQPISVDSNDELGQLAVAFNAIQEVTQQVAVEQSTLLRKGISDIFVNLARRNQSLLDRQIEFIDHLESREQDPDQLANLFKLDHLATRMRRNAESLLVLAGAEPARRKGRPVAMADVVRVAMGEVEQFGRINLLAIDDAHISATVAVDVAHLLSELMENATQFSPPETRVEIVGLKTRDGDYVVSVSDHGIGMSDQQLIEANRLIANPPLIGLALSRSLGFVVIGRLAARLGITVRLAAAPAGGLSALVTLPAPIVDVEPVATAVHRAQPAEPVAIAPPAAPVRSAEPAPRHDAPATVSAPAQDRAPVETPQVPAPDRGPRPETFAEPVAAQPAPSLTSAGLVRRVPKAPAAAGPAGPAITAPQRSPEQVRQMLSRYRSGLERGRTDEGAERPVDHHDATGRNR